MNQLLNLGETLTVNAQIYPERVAAGDLRRCMTFRQWNERACRLANALLGIGLARGDRVAILAYNCVEWLEIYAATAKAGLVAVPINFRLVGAEIQYIAQDAGARAFIVQDDLRETVESIRHDLQIPTSAWIHFGGRDTPCGYRAYEDVIARASASEPAMPAKADDTWALMYTSGTTGRPKGAIRDHGTMAVLSLISELEFGFTPADTALLVMPMCHANSMNFFAAFAYCGASCFVYDRKHFDPEHLLRTFSEKRVAFTSLVPTHYIMMLGLAEKVRQRYDADSVTKLLVSSAPARRETKLAIMEHFRHSQLYELYGSSEAGWVTILRPEEQLTKLGSVGRECVGSGRIQLLDDSGEEVCADGVGELYSRTPYTFSGYWNQPGKTVEAFRGAYCTVGDMARRDEDGYYYLVDRKTNMIISGGENVYPSEVESVLASNPAVQDVAVIGVAHEKWGEAVHAVVVLHQQASLGEADLLSWCKDRIAGYKRPRSVSFLAEEEMPRTATGKILHRELKARFDSGHSGG